MLYVKTKNEKDIATVLTNLRNEDEAEMLEEFGRSWYKTLFFECKKNDIFIIKNSFHTPVGLFGIKPHINYAEICLLCTDELKDDAISFLLQARKYVNKLLKEYRRLENYVHKKNKSAISWLKWLGFTLEDFDKNKMYFYKEMK